MTNLEFKKYRKKLFPHPFEAARALGITYNSLNHYEAGRRPVPLWVIKFFQCIEANRATSGIL